MVQNEFLSQLKDQLKELPEADRQDILYDYEEHFRLGLEEGKTEEEIAASLGQPKAIAKEVKAEFRVKEAKSKPSFESVVKAVLSTVSLGFFNLIFILGPFFAVVGVLLSIYAASIGLLLSPIAVLFGWGQLGGSANWLMGLFSIVALLSAGVLLGVASIVLTRWFVRVLIKYLQFNVNIIKGR
ncbi:DUF1700 domain-containing protein [Fictibacillus sp. WQ 8-8]|uniref:HAAS signaling domain-containing protein n=1 Tax=Fictibacillus sp. WQ 8-8 TaxID=2938788 RepID=UPI00210E6E32|nr:DUF1700 domain-containing protein [Fictibacillus sp. WQ 8-8]MCQ6268313.1 DUF1700 domain-containing protein [Fictibacillus sp. WQ 8-8]